MRRNFTLDLDTQDIVNSPEKTRTRGSDEGCEYWYYFHVELNPKQKIQYGDK